MDGGSKVPPEPSAGSVEMVETGDDSDAYNGSSLYTGLRKTDMVLEDGPQVGRPTGHRFFFRGAREKTAFSSQNCGV